MSSLIVAIDLDGEITPGDAEEILSAIASQLVDVQDEDDDEWPVKSGQVSNGFTVGYWRVQESHDSGASHE